MIPHQRGKEVRGDGGRNFGPRRDGSRGETDPDCKRWFLNPSYLGGTGLLEWCFRKSI